MSPSEPKKIRIYFKNDQLKVKPRWAELEVGVDYEVEWESESNVVTSFDVKFATSPFASSHFSQSQSKSGNLNVSVNEGEEKLFKYVIEAVQANGKKDKLDPGIIIWK